MTPQDALALINRTIRQVNTTADNHDLLEEAVGTLAKAIIKSRPAKPVQRLGAFEEAQW